MSIIAKLSPISPRHDDWLRVFGTDEMPIDNATPHGGWKPDRQFAMFYAIRVDQLTEEQLVRLVAHLAAKFRLDPVAVRLDLAITNKLPILAEDVLVLEES